MTKACPTPGSLTGAAPLNWEDEGSATAMAINVDQVAAILGSSPINVIV
jgi:hypothetical protein